MNNFVLTLTAPKEHGLEEFDTDASIWSATDAGKTSVSRYTGDTARFSVMQIQGVPGTLGDGNTLGDSVLLNYSVAGKGEGAYKDYSVTSGVRYTLSCLYKVVSGALTIQLYDQTNGTLLETVDKIDTVWRNYEPSTVMPAGCTTLRVSFLQSESDAMAGPFYIDNVSLSGNVLLYDPDSYSRVPERVGTFHQTLGGRRVYDLRAIHYSLYLDWNFFKEDQYENLREVYYSNELLYFDDGNVPALIEGEEVYETAQYDYTNMTNPSSTHKAYSDNSSSLPSSKSDFEATEYATGEYQAIDEDDSNYKETTNPSDTEYLYHKFLIQSSIDKNDVKRFRVRIKISSDDSSPQDLDGGVLYAWNGTNWVELTRNTNSSIAYLTYSTAEAEVAKLFVDSGDNYIRLLLRSRNRRNVTNALNLRTYYVECEINEGLNLIVELTHKAILDDNDDVVWVKNLTQGTTLRKDMEYTISPDRREVSVAGVYAHLDGNTQYFYRNDADFPESGITDDMTIQAWVRVDAASISSINDIVRKFETSGQYCYAFRFTEDGKLRFFVSTDGTASSYMTTNDSVVVADTWIHVAVVYNASEGICTFYRNGEALSASGSLPNSIFDGTSIFTVGSHISVHDFDGSISRVAVFNGTRTGPEILDSYNNPNEDLSGATNIVAQWYFNDTGPATAIDNTQGDSGRDLIPYNGGNTTFANCGREESAAAGEEVEVKYNRYFEVMFASIPEDWYNGDPSSGDRPRSSEIVLQTLSESR